MATNDSNIGSYTGFTPEQQEAITAMQSNDSSSPAEQINRTPIDRRIPTITRDRSRSFRTDAGPTTWYIASCRCLQDTGTCDIGRRKSRTAAVADAAKHAAEAMHAPAGIDYPRRWDDRQHREWWWRGYLSVEHDPEVQHPEWRNAGGKSNSLKRAWRDGWKAKAGCACTSREWCRNCDPTCGGNST